MAAPTARQIEQYYDEGYFITEAAVEPEMLEALTAALRRALAMVRSGEVVDDTAGIGAGGPGVEQTQFLWGLLAPEYGEPVFAEYLTSEPILRHARPLVGDVLRLGSMVGFAIQHCEYHTGWHRDFGKEERDGSYDVEMEILGRYNRNQIEWHLALVDDACLWVVPGSNRRYRTDREREVLINSVDNELEGSLQIELKRGQTIFWTGNVIHRGLLPEGVKERLTLAGSLVRHQEDDAPTPLDDRCRWLMADNLRDNLPESVQPLYNRWRSLQRV